jgi:hypothetical protein
MMLGPALPLNTFAAAAQNLRKHEELRPVVKARRHDANYKVR